MDHVTFLEEPSLGAPPIVCAFKGWNDGGEAASTAARYLIQRWAARPFAHLDPEEFYDFQVARPMVHLEGGVSRVIEWPRGEFFAASVNGQDVALFTAIEPNVRWRTYADDVIGVARAIGSKMLVTLGAFLTDVPHTRPVPVVGSAASEEAAGRLGLAPSHYEGPTGIVGVLHDASNRAGLTSVSLWAAVPHYLPAAANPKAALALVERTSDLLDVSIDTSSLSEAAATWQEGVARLVDDSEELREYVERLEAAADERGAGNGDGPAGEPVPSGEAIAAELERYLRERDVGDAPG